MTDVGERRTYVGGHMKRRDFLELAGLGGLAMALPRASRAATTPNIDPRSPEGFGAPLLVPTAGADLFGIVDAGTPLDITALPVTASLISGTQQNLLAYRVSDGRMTSVNPLLRARPGTPVRALLRNRLDQSTIIHWHGFVVDSRNDGIPQETIAPGATYAYDFAVKNRGGTYWYHPHPMVGTSEQAYRGMASFFLVEDDDDLRLRAALGLELGVNEIPVVIQDKRLDPTTRDIVYNPSDQDWFMGFLGDVILANLTLKPLWTAAPGPLRLRLLNGSNARIYRLAFLAGSRRIPFSVLGNDGGLLPSPVPAQEAFLAPGERLDVLLDLADLAGADVFLKSLVFDPLDNESMSMSGAASGGSTLDNGEEFYVLKIAVQGGAPRRAPLPPTLSRVDPIDVRGAYRRSLPLTQRMMQWYIAGNRYNINAYPIQVRRGTVEIWDIANSGMSMPHPMHIHGYQFQVLSRRGSPAQVAALAGRNGLLPSDQGFKDTVLTWPGETVSVAIDFRQAFPGVQSYVFHCHNLEHEERGMMVNYRVL